MVRLESLVHQLSLPQAPTRRPFLLSITVARLRQLGPQALPHLIGLLRSQSHYRVQAAVVELLRPLGSMARDSLFDTLHETSGLERLCLVRALSRLGDPRVLPAVVELSRENPPWARFEAVQCLSHVGAVAPLLELLEDPDINLRGQAAGALHRLGPAAVPALLDRLDDPRPEIRGQVILSLAWLGDPRAAPGLRQLWSQNQDPKALFALGKIKDRDSFSLLLEATHHPHLEACCQAVTALGEVGLPEAADRLGPWPAPTRSVRRPSEAWARFEKGWTR